MIRVDNRKPLLISAHAKQRMIERRVAVEMLEETLFKGSHHQGTNGRMVAEKALGHAMIRVVYVETLAHYFIFTVTKG